MTTKIREILPKKTTRLVAMVKFLGINLRIMISKYNYIYNYIKVTTLAAAFIVLALALILTHAPKPGFRLYSYLLIFLSIVIISTIVIITLEKEYLKRFVEWLSENASRLTIVFLTALFVVLVSLYFFSFEQIVVEPERFEVKIPAGDSLAGIISIKNLGISDENIAIKTEFIDSWINMAPKNFTISSGQTKNINFSINIPLQAPLGEYREAIKIIYKNNTIAAEMPILLTVQLPAQFQATIDSPKVNKTDYFKVKIDIRNVGDSPVYGVRMSISNLTGLNLAEAEEKNKTIDLIPKKEALFREWWFKPNETLNKTEWPTIQFDINSTNAGNQTVITKVNISG